MNKAPLLLFVVSLILSPQAIASTKPGIQQQHRDVRARFFYSAETAYQAIEIDGLKLKVTYFKDADKKCKNWIEQRPCWAEKDLTIKEVQLAKGDLTELTRLINRSGFLLLEKSYGGAKAGQRFYTETLNVKLGEVRHEVVYQSFPEAEPRPEAFKKVSRWLMGLVKRKLRL